MGLGVFSRSRAWLGVAFGIEPVAVLAAEMSPVGTSW
jgi:hypothetical protein